MEIGWIVRLLIPWFKKTPRYFLIYQKTHADYILLNITGKNKGNDPEISQYSLKDTIKLPGHEVSLINLNVLILIENNFFFELLRKVKQSEEILKLSKEDFNKITKSVSVCFSNEMFSGNLYELRVLPNR